jgi:hypothetical protein
VTLQDGVGSPAPAFSAATVTFRSSSPETTFYLDAACATPRGSFVVPSGGTGFTLHTKDALAGSHTLWLDWEITGRNEIPATVLPGPAAILELEAPRQALIEEPTTARVAARDRFGNDASAPLALTFSSSDASATLPPPQPPKALPAHFEFVLRTPGAQLLTVTSTEPALQAQAQIQVGTAEQLARGPHYAVGCTGSAGPGAAWLLCLLAPLLLCPRCS